MGDKKYRILFAWPIVIVCMIIWLFLVRSEKVYVLKTYNSAAKTTSIFHYVIRNGDTVFHGKYTTYNSKGNKIGEGNFVDDEPRGKSIDYYDNGIISAVHYRIKSKLDAESTWNYPNGKIERYILYDEFGNSVFILRFDEQGNVKSYSGLPLIETYQFKIANKEKFKINVNQYLKVGDSLKYKYLLANLPKAKRDFKIELMGSENFDIKRTFYKKLPTTLDVQEILTKRGINTVRAIVQYKFDDRENTVIKDTVSFDVEVH